LRSLVGVDYFGHSVFCHSCFKHIHASLFTHGVADAPTHDFPAVHVNLGSHEHKASWR
jgi:hypothetical protein